MRIVPPQMWNCHFASLWKNNKRPCLFSKKANCKLEVIVIQLSFSFLWREAIFMLHSIPAFRNAFFFVCVCVWYFHRFILQMNHFCIVKKKVSFESLLEAWLLYAARVNNQFSGISLKAFNSEAAPCAASTIQQETKKENNNFQEMSWEKHLF